MKIKEVLDIINDTRTVRAKFEKSKLTFAAKENLGGGHWGFWFLRMNEGDMAFDEGDWIATGIDGEHWAIADDIFRRTYEEVSNK